VFCAAVFSCGVEDYPYLEQVPPEAVMRPSYTKAVVSLPARRDLGGFLRYSIFYRIYISDAQITSSIGASEMTNINSSLRGDYSYIEPYTQKDNNLAANTGSLFSNRNYFEIELEEREISDILGETGAFSIAFDFSDVSPGLPPRLVKGGLEFTLRRSTGSGLFSPVPKTSSGDFDGRFVNTEALNKSENATSAINRDVAGKTISSGASRYTYASLYICAVGINGVTLTPVYSAPTFIGVFILPKKWWQGEE
jgi:hypothetical protein